VKTAIWLLAVVQLLTIVLVFLSARAAFETTEKLCNMIGIDALRPRMECIHLHSQRWQERHRLSQ